MQPRLCAIFALATLTSLAALASPALAQTGPSGPVSCDAPGFAGLATSDMGSLELTAYLWLDEPDAVASWTIGEAVYDGGDGNDVVLCEADGWGTEDPICNWTLFRLALVIDLNGQRTVTGELIAARPTFVSPEGPYRTRAFRVVPGSARLDGERVPELLDDMLDAFSTITYQDCLFLSLD